jgi:putative addiction module component (TIGR02574 family)
MGMSNDDDIFLKALSLPGQARAELADRLLESLDEADSSDVDDLWAREAEDRIAAFERGELVAIPGEEVFASLRLR